MTRADATMRWTATEPRPLVLALTGTPLLTGLLRDLLGESAVVRCFPAASPDLQGLVRDTRPDAIVVDSEETALELAEVTAELRAPLVEIRLRSRELRVLRHGEWDAGPRPLASPTTIRNALLGELFRAPTAAFEQRPALAASAPEVAR